MPCSRLPTLSCLSPAIAALYLFPRISLFLDTPRVRALVPAPPHLPIRTPVQALPGQLDPCRLPILHERNAAHRQWGSRFLTPPFPRRSRQFVWPPFRPCLAIFYATLLACFRFFSLFSRARVSAPPPIARPTHHAETLPPPRARSCGQARRGQAVAGCAISKSCPTFVNSLHCPPFSSPSRRLRMTHSRVFEKRKPELHGWGRLCAARGIQNRTLRLHSHGIVSAIFCPLIFFSCLACCPIYESLLTDL